MCQGSGDIARSIFIIQLIPLINLVPYCHWIGLDWFGRVPWISHAISYAHLISDWPFHTHITFILIGYGPTTVWDARLSWSRTQRCSTRLLPRYEFCFQAFLFVKFSCCDFFGFCVRLGYDLRFCSAEAVFFAALILWYSCVGACFSCKNGH